MRFLHYITLGLILLLTSEMNAQQYNSSQQDFSVSKPTYKVHSWQNLEFDKFRVHFYGRDEAQTQAENLAQDADQIITRMEEYFDTESPSKIDIILYNSYHDYYYSNINKSSIDGENELEIRFVPGHAPGHIVFINHNDKYVINGDCLFMGSIGRTDLPGGNHEQLLGSIKRELFSLPEDYKVYCGHGPETTIGHEKQNNPFLN